MSTEKQVIYSRGTVNREREAGLPDCGAVPTLKIGHDEFKSRADARAASLPEAQGTFVREQYLAALEEMGKEHDVSQATYIREAILLLRKKGLHRKGGIVRFARRDNDTGIEKNYVFYGDQNNHWICDDD